MKTNVLFIGLDVDDNKFHAYAISQSTGEFLSFSTRPTAKKLIEKLKKLEMEGYIIKLCYEACYLGFSLCRKLLEAKIHCEVIASNMIPSRPGDKVKTDKKDSKNLAILYMKGMLTVVNIPTKEEEDDRDLIRSREFLVGQLNSLKNHITSLCRRANLNFKQETDSKCYWTKTHFRWLQDQTSHLSPCALKTNFNMLLLHMKELQESINTYDAEIEKMASRKTYSKRVQALTCYKGISELTALSVITEIGDIKRFPHPKKLVSYLGLDITEYSSGGKEKKYGITKMGNSRIRKRLVESCQKCHLNTFPHSKKFRGRNNVPKDILSIADKCMKRLHIKSTRLIFREKNRNKVKVACAREMSTFIWESLMAVA